MRCIVYILTLFVLLAGCSSHKAENPAPQAPAAATLVFPAQNSLCVSGNVISAAQSSVQLQWNQAANADSYTVTVKDLLSGQTSSQTVAQTQVTFTLSRNTPFSWNVISKSSTTSQTATSDTWKFYNAGDGVTSYAPFPADNMIPSDGQSVDVTSGTITLSWTGADPDNDVANYDVYFGTTQSPPLYKATNASASLSNVQVNPQTTYYWKIVTRDSNNNTSESQVVKFQTK